MLITYKNPKLGNYLHYAFGGEAQALGPEQILIGYKQVEVGRDDDGDPIIGDGPAIYEDGDDLFAVDWQDSWGEPISEEQLEAWEEPEPDPPSPVTDVERMASLFAQAQQAAPAALNQLKGMVWAALVAGGMAQDEATAAGVALVLLHGPLLAAFEAAGGHPLAAQALYEAIASEPSRQALQWLSDPILAIFRAALTPGK